MPVQPPSAVRQGPTRLGAIHERIFFEFENLIQRVRCTTGEKQRQQARPHKIPIRGMAALNSDRRIAGEHRHGGDAILRQHQKIEKKLPDTGHTGTP